MMWKVNFHLVSEMNHQNIPSSSSSECLAEDAATIDSPIAIRRLSQDNNVWIRGGIAQNPLTSAKILDRLSRDTDWIVRAYVAEHPNVSQKALDSLAQDSVEEVRVIARKRR